ncbi:hypothetical protein HUK80_10175 [Flavobacterium sp. MAH-1]|uniref:Oxygen tolerance n=1 Tax=Flavobacterium agri TaxID=2743471 RepID=A0A7Y8Y2I0_9FLAO|nr:hypothetical protein [Flavobacterium agri]NUY81262.1 hypothetical protein [Flavobacterium agri]NYA71286.1 hypothetical protein [Flavobacterium agri]
MKKILYIALLLISTFGVSQKRVETSIDTTKNKIGAQFNLTLRVKADTTETVVFPHGNHFGPLEVIRSYVVDTVKKDNRYELVKKYGLTQFDSGKYKLPRLPILIDNKPFYSDSLNVEVGAVAVDTLKQKMYDIKPIMAAESIGIPMWVYILIVLAIIGGLGYLTYALVKKFQKKKTEEVIYKTPIEKATALLSNLEKKQLVQRGEVKDYYSELTDIARTYIEEVVHIPAMESTTSELIVALREAASNKKMPVNQETFENLERVLKTADLVKFAKSRPLDFEIEGDKEKIEKVIVVIDKSVPKEEEDEETEAFRELQRRKMLNRQKRNRILLTVGVVFLLLFATTVYFVMTKGFDYVKDNIIGHPTKDLVEGEWVNSEYGNPAIVIETPKVLKRIDAEKLFPKEVIALLKDYQTFVYGSMVDDFYISVATLSYKSEVQIDLSKSIEGSIAVVEQMGARNMIVKQEEYQTGKGLEGRKAYGTFSRKNAKGEDVKLVYQMLVFGQQNGLQQIVLMYREDDQYAKQMADRILNSVELKQVMQ